MRKILALILSFALFLGAGIRRCPGVLRIIFSSTGKVFTVDGRFSSVQAVAVSGERFTAVGSNETIRKLAGKNTKVIDLKGKTVIPGLIDNHVHFLRHAARWNNEARLDGMTSRNKSAGRYFLTCKKTQARRVGHRHGRLGPQPVSG